MMRTPPRSLYVHAPWCLNKCPYCDFNAYALGPGVQQKAYMSALLKDFRRSMRLFPQEAPPPSIYFGGGTPSLIDPVLWRPLFQELHQKWPLVASGCEITMEISPLAEASRLEDFIALGVNRFSAGVQSFQEPLLRLLGREHHSEHSHRIAELTQRWPQVRWNIDLIYGLRAQSPEQVAEDIRLATQSSATHLSWYELMIEQNTAFARTPEVKAPEEQLSELEHAGSALLDSWEHYEVSAYARDKHYSRHNLGYWMYEDYLGIGAGAHSKITLHPRQDLRFYKTRTPHDYQRSQRLILDKKSDPATDFLLSRLRVFRPIDPQELDILAPQERQILLHWLEQQKHSSHLWEKRADHLFMLSPTGRLFISDLLEIWLSYREARLASK